MRLVTKSRKHVGGRRLREGGLGCIRQEERYMHSISCMAVAV